MAGKIIIEFDQKGQPTEIIEGEIPLPIAIVALEVMRTRLVHNIIATQQVAAQARARQGLVMPDGTPARSN